MEKKGLTFEVAAGPRAVREAQRLRYEVFAAELGADVDGAAAGVDQDRFDAHCRHLLVRDAATGEPVATTRVLTSAGAAAGCGFYSQGEFEIAPILRLPGNILEVGRTCVRSDHRGGAAIATLWSGLARLWEAEQARWLIGCASIPVERDGSGAGSIVAELRTGHLAPETLRVRPRQVLPVAAGSAAPARMPHLLRLYLRLGAKVCGEPFWDRDFRAADVFILVEVARMDPRFVRHFLGKREVAA